MGNNQQEEAEVLEMGIIAKLGTLKNCVSPEVLFQNLLAKILIAAALFFRQKKLEIFALVLVLSVFQC
eukprot:IDg6477t1